MQFGNSPRVQSRLSLGYVSAVWIALAAMQANVVAQIPTFKSLEIDSAIGNVCYAVTVADVDGDGRQDCVAISESQVVWYRNPDWKKFVILDDQLPRDLVCIAPADIDADGRIDFAVGSGWPQNGGSLHWIGRSGAGDDSWKAYPIGAEPWTHRMRFADVLGTGKPQLVVSPLNATTGSGVRLLAFPVPEDPKGNQWRPVVIDGSLNRLHNHWHIPGSRSAGNPGRATEQTLTASQEGLHRLERMPSGEFTKQFLAAGAQGEQPTQRGMGEVKLGKWSEETLLVAAIEPMHGTDVVLYRFQAEPFGGSLQRILLDDTFQQGHAIALADLDGDGHDEVIAGYREPSIKEPKGPGIYLYHATDNEGDRWSRTPLDIEKMACEDLICFDCDDDGDVDILAGGRATKNVRLYVNQRIP